MNELCASKDDNQENNACINDRLKANRFKPASRLLLAENICKITSFLV